MSKVARRLGSRAAGALAALTLVGGMAALPTVPASADGGSFVYGLVVTEGSGVVTATWNATAELPTLRHARAAHESPRGEFISFECSLLYGWGTPTTATQVTGQRTCSFYSLDTSRVWGVEVQELNYYGEPFGYAQVAFGAPVKTSSGGSGTVRSIVCKRGSVIKAVTGVNPHCAAGWRRVG